jgi:hypothetical protein
MRSTKQTIRRELAAIACHAAFMFSVSGSAHACATIPDASAQHVRVLADTCGTATFAVPASDRQTATLSLNVARGQAYMRTLRLSYGSGINGLQAEMRVHRLVGEGEATPLFATKAADGRPLISIVVEMAPPGRGGEPVVLVLGDGGNRPLTTGALAPKQQPATPLDTRDWVLAASVRANLAARRDVLEIGRQKGRLESLALSTRGADIPVQSVQIIPFDGQVFTVDHGTTLTAGAVSVPIMIDPPDFIRAVVVTYGTPSPQAVQRTSVIEVRARQSESWGGPIGENRQYAGGWMLIGTVDVIVAPHHVRPPFRLPVQQGTFKKLRFIARRSAIDLAGVTVEAGEGRSETLAINTLLTPDQPSQAQGFSNGAALPISAISLMPRLRSQSRMDATLEVWAQY